MPKSRRSTQALAHLRHMTSLDCSGPECIAPVLQELRHLIGFETSAYFHAAADGTLDAHVADDALLAPLSNHFGDPAVLRSEAELFDTVLQQGCDIARHPRGPQTLAQMLRVPRASLLRSAYYDRVMCPGGVADWLALPLRAPQGQAIGMLFLFRAEGGRAFSRSDAAQLARLEVNLARVLQPTDLLADDSEVLREALLIAAPTGRPMWLSPEAESLLALAFGWRWRGAHGGALPQPLKLLAQRVRWPRPAQISAQLPAPQAEIRNAHGWFMLRALPLAAAGQGGEEGEAVAIQITQRAARGARLLAALRALGLPQRQVELAWWLARDLPEPRIAEHMGISAHTVVYHRRELYARLGVASRGDLLACLGV